MQIEARLQDLEDLHVTALVRVTFEGLLPEDARQDLHLCRNISADTSRRLVFLFELSHATTLSALPPA